MADEVYLVRHGQTEWSHAGRHTGRTDIALTAVGRERAVGLGSLIAQLVDPASLHVRTSPLGRAVETCRLAGFDSPTVDHDLTEWDYGDFEGTRTVDIRETVPGWSVWTHPVTHGESLADVGERADRVLQRIRVIEGPVALFAHAHLLRILAARWLRLDPAGGRLFALDAASLSRLAHERETPVIGLWNVTARRMPEAPGPRV